MNLFINAVSKNGKLVLFDDSRKIVSSLDLQIAGNESEKLIKIVDGFLSSDGLTYKDLENIVVVLGPGSFTGVRTIVLMVNTINFVINKNITGLNFFDLFQKYPICKPSSKRDCFVKKQKGDKIEIIKNDDLERYFKENNIKKVYGELNKDFSLELETIDFINYESIIQNIKLDNKKIVEPIYIKKPNIS